jgi:hypothetical protein
MKLNDNKLFAQMRTATRTLMEQGPAAATSALQKILGGSGAKAEDKAAPMRDINPPPHAGKAATPVPPTPTHDGTDILNRLMPDLKASLERAGAAGRAAFKMPDFEMPSFDLNRATPGAQGPAEALPGEFIDGSHTNAAGTRSFKLYVPSSYTGKQQVPLIVMLHGCTQDPEDFARGTQMNQLAEEMECLVVYPAQSQQANMQRCWNWFSAVDQTRDQGEPSIIAGITHDVMASHAIDAGQVYVAGLSARWPPSWARCIRSCTRPLACTRDCRSPRRTTCRRRWPP